MAIRQRETETIDPDETAKVAAAQQNPAAFEQFYLNYSDQVFRYLYSRVGQRAEAEDLTAQTFLAALEALPSYRHRGHFAAWLFSIAHNKVMDYFRAGREQSSLDDVEKLPGSQNLTQEQIDNDRVRKLKGLIAQLPKDEQELLRLRYVAELRFSEISFLFKRKPDAMKKRFYRVLARLQNQLEDSDE